MYYLALPAPGLCTCRISLLLTDILASTVDWFLPLVHNNFSYDGLLLNLLEYRGESVIIRIVRGLNIEVESQSKRIAKWHFLLNHLSKSTLFLLTGWEISWNNHISRRLQRCYMFEKAMRKVAACFPWRLSWEALAQLAAAGCWSSYSTDIAEKIQFGTMEYTEQQKCLLHANSA